MCWVTCELLLGQRWTLAAGIESVWIAKWANKCVYALVNGIREQPYLQTRMSALDGSEKSQKTINDVTIGGFLQPMAKNKLWLKVKGKAAIINIGYKT